MKKIIAALTLLLILMTIAGCSKKNQEEPVTDPDSIETNTNVDEQETNIPQGEEDSQDQETDNPDGAETPEDDKVETPNDDSEDDSKENEVETPVDDTYLSASEPIEFDYSQFEEIEPLEITDEQIIASLSDYLSEFYFNYFFYDALDKESGEIDADTMTLFALSYIMQHEYDELRFDYETYELYIPKKQVVDVVEKFFYRRLDVFHEYEEPMISLTDDAYIVKVEASGWDVEMKVTKVEKLGDFTFRVSCDITNKASGELVTQITAIVDESNNSYVLMNYSMTEAE